ncbi:hypothetical protein KJK34_07250 [Flavobacterium sp. D11R37]|uniref:DUF6443 domain-containing protein n=1 Tax=Flavobacterium coralii TaxID=2838017 RepID=UPI001CA7012D|nr:DUF6443 domain-containing protein [Flavobacterium coralii]MBY8962546.1 hypothetical protein [Flavobacterium coralii]
MRNYITLILFITSYICYAQISQDKNYVIYSTYKSEVKVSNETQYSSTPEHVTYFDGQGREIQLTSIEYGGNSEDVSIHRDYDAIGREEKEYLAVPKSQNAGAYINNIENDIYSYYNTPKYGYTTNPYTEIVFDEVKINLPKEVAHPGNVWHKQNEHTYKYEQITNNSLDNVVIIYRAVFDSNNQSLLKYEGQYALNTLIKEVHKNENWTPSDGNNNTTQIFTNYRGKIVLKRNFNNSVPHDTYYVYDDADNLIYIIPPNVDSQILIDQTLYGNQAILDKYCYQYIYDYDNRVIEKKLPGVSWQYFVYGKYGRPALTQTANQRLNNQWSFVKYDPLGREAYSGTFHTDEPFSRQEMQILIEDWEWYVKRTNTPTNINGINVYYDNYTNHDLFVKNIYYYDNYSFDMQGISIPSTSDYGDEIKTAPKGLLTGSKTRIGETSDFVTCILGYSKNDRLIYAADSNPYLSTNNLQHLKLDFLGKIMESKSIHNKAGVVNNLVTYDYFSYDSAERLTRHNQKVGSNPTELITFNKYDELGNFDSKKVGNGQTLTTLTGISFSNGIYTKTATTTSWSNAVLASTTKITGNGSMSFRVGNSSNNQLRIGLSTTPASTNYLQIDYSIALTSANHSLGGKTAWIQENGTTLHTTNFYPNDEFTIEKNFGVINYKKNGVIIHTSATQTINPVLYADGHFYTYGSNISNLNFNNYDYNNATSLQAIDYNFNVRGMLTSINDVNGGPGTGLFNMQIDYTSSSLGGNAYYNGNVSQISWKTINDQAQTLRAYTFEYDHLHRMTDAKYSTISGPTTSTGMYDELVRYDKVGNITSLKRKGSNAYNPIYIDQLSYQYDGNQLKAVSDQSTNVLGFKDGANLVIEYTYDNDGNMISDANKGITNIVYNEMNLPTLITFTGNNRKIEFVYDGLGNKLSKKKYDGSSQTTTEYSGSYVYVKENTNAVNLQYITHSEGYINYNSGVVSYIFQYTDHLGNVRLAYTDANKNGIVTTDEIVQESNYYPLGLKHTGYNSNYMPIGNSFYKYGFQGQELQDDLGLNWSSFKWRNYDSALGRFFSIDPLAEKYHYITPYQFSSNQPIHAPELEGLESANEQNDELDWFDFADSYQPDGDDALPELNFEMQEVVIEGEVSVNGDEDFTDNEGFSIEDALESAFEFAPFTGGVMDMYRGARDGDWLQFTIGAISLAADVATLGSATAVTSVVKVSVKRVVKEATKKAAKEGSEGFMRFASKDDIAVYISRTVDGAIQYVGITNNIARRAAEHLASKGIRIAELMKNLSRKDAKAVEQALIEIYGLGKNGGTLLNKINSISARNPNYASQLERGYEILKSIGYQ